MKSYVYRFPTTNEQGDFSCEIYSRRAGLGVGYYHPDLMRHIPETARANTLSVNQAAAKVIAFTETDEIIKRINEGGSVNVQGDLGCGKSHALNDMRFRLRTHGLQHAFIDMHNGLSPSRFEAVVGWARRTGGVMIADSFDYVSAYCGKNRSTNRAKVETNASEVVSILGDALSTGVQAVLTTHTAPWLAKHSKTDILSDAMERWERKGRMSTMRIFGMVEPAMITQTVDKINPLNDYPKALTSTEYASIVATHANEALQQYRVMKLLLSSRELADMALQGEVDQAVGIIDRVDRGKVDAPDTYSFLPVNDNLQGLQAVRFNPALSVLVYTG